MEALVPRVTKPGGVRPSAVPEPSAAATAATASPRFPDGSAFAAYRTDGCRRDCLHLNRALVVRETNKTTLKLKHTVMYLHGISLELTLACLHSVRPHVINIFVAPSSAVLKPSTPRSATTDPAGLLELATFCARYLVNWGDNRRDNWRGDSSSDYELPFRF